MILFDGVISIPICRPRHEIERIERRITLHDMRILMSVKPFAIIRVKNRTLTPVAQLFTEYARSLVKSRT
jgi:hypothetical protein